MTCGQAYGLVAFFATLYYILFSGAQYHSPRAGVQCCSGYRCGGEALHLGVGVELVEVADAQGEVGVGEELHGLGFLYADEEHGDVLLDGGFLEQACVKFKGMLHKVVYSK